MKKLFLIFAIFLFSNITFSQNIEIGTSKIHGLIWYTFSNLGLQNYSPALKEITEKSKYADQVKQITSELKDVIKYLHLDFNFPNSINGYRDGVSVINLFEIQSGYATTVDDLFLRLKGLMPQAEFIKLKRAILKLQPIYENLVWNPNEKHLKKMIKEIRLLSKNWDVNKKLQMCKLFYNSEWDRSENFKISFFPLPKNSKTSNGRSQGGFESVGLIIGDKNYLNRFSVVFHEMMHSLYQTQSNEQKQKILNSFNLETYDDDLPFRLGAHYYLNEVLATALGNGWFYESSSGKYNQKSWYVDDFIDPLAKGVYDLTKKYLQESKSLDDEYIKKYIALFKLNFPDYKNSKQYLFSNLEINYSGADYKSMEIRSFYRKHIEEGKLSINAGKSFFKASMLDYNSNLFFMHVLHFKNILLFKYIRLIKFETSKHIL